MCKNIIAASLNEMLFRHKHKNEEVERDEFFSRDCKSLLEILDLMDYI